MKQRITVSRLRELLTYDPETGVFRWSVVGRRSPIRVGSQAGSVTSDGCYIQVGVDGWVYPAHRLAWLYVYGYWPKLIDHVNGNGKDNRICNLRDVDHSINMQNKRGARGYTKATSPNGRVRFIAKIFVDGKINHLGSFDCEERARDAYIEAKRRLHVGCTI